MNQQQDPKKQLELAQAKDSTDEGRNGAMMTKDSWNQDGNPAAAHDPFGPEMNQEAPPTVNGKPSSSGLGS
ncbi:hypothetical protein [Paenibacillus gansuensis]|uniref:Uncharacterized protein n=1 Tax=Paenibacillus gansuensis TaxID=306542 RepID=A0ABW5PD30_9BACL